MADEKTTPLGNIPVLAVRGMVLFPKIILHFDVGREKSILALNEAMGEDDRHIFIVAQKDIRTEDPNKDEIYKVGVVAEVKQIIKSSNYLRVLVEGKYRATLTDLTQEEPYLMGTVEEYPVNSPDDPESPMMKALIRTVRDLFEEYGMRTPRMARELVFGALTIDDPLFLSEYIASNLPISFEDKQEILEESDVTNRLELLAKILEEENNILTLEQEIQDKVREQIDSNQREFYLREQMKAISAELDEADPAQDEIAEYNEKIDSLELDEEVSDKLRKEVDRLQKMPSNSHESGVIRNWLDTCLALPWNITTKDHVDIDSARAQLDHDHYGMKKVKERILEMMAVYKLAPNQKGQIICLVGPPGVGKTSIARSVAEAMNRNYVRMSLGGVRDESDIRGHRKTYIGAMPGRIMTALQQSGSNNPLMLLDEVDKLGSDFRGDPSAALLEVLDAEQNFAFRDHYIELPFDLSKVLFLATANDLGTIPRPLLDRMEVIELGSYTREEKYQIAKRHLVPKQIKRHGLTAQQMSITEAALYSIVDNYTREAGVRTLERQIASLCRKAAKEIVAGKSERISVTLKKLHEYLGPHRFKDEDITKNNEIGIVNGLAWTTVGGAMLQVEVAILDGNGKIVLTGSLGDVMKESAQAAISYVRSCSHIYNIDPDFYKTKDIHIHVPEGAVPKDGPSAGVTIVTALVSALSGIPVHGEVAMTGEISLRGRVLAIGGLREKAMAAYRNGIKTIVIPEANLPDLEDVDEVVKEGIKFVPAKELSIVLNTALTKNYKLTESQIKKRALDAKKKAKQQSEPLAQNR